MTEDNRNDEFDKVIHPTGEGDSARIESRQATDQAEPDSADALTLRRETGETEQEPKSRRIWREVKSWVRDLIVAAAICILLIVYVAQPFRVEKSSMETLLHDGDRILVSKISLLFEPIKRGDIVVLWNPRDPNESWIKRVIGLPGEEVRIERGIVYINDKPLKETYIPRKERIGRKNEYPHGRVGELVRQYPKIMEEFGLVLRRNPGPRGRKKVAQRVPEGYYFVLGDHRTLSMDSRDSVFYPGALGPGLIPARYIYGKAVFRYWPLDKISVISSATYTEQKKGEK